MLCIGRPTNPLILILGITVTTVIIIHKVDQEFKILKPKIDEWNTIMTETTMINTNLITWQLKDSHVQYSGDFLWYIKTRTEHNRKLRILPMDACVKIRALRINKRKTCRSKNKKPRSKDAEPRSVNYSNLTQVKITNDRRVRKFTKHLNIVLINSQSIKSKDELIAEYLISNNIDACILTETWLTNSDNDTIWLEYSEMGQNGYKINNINRKDRKGGGLAIIYKNHLKVNIEKSGATQSFEYALWTLSTTSSRTSILAIYHPPYLEKTLSPITCSWMSMLSSWQMF